MDTTATLMLTVVTYTMQGNDNWKCEEKSANKCLKKPWERCGDKHGPYEGCMCTNGYECMDKVCLSLGQDHTHSICSSDPHTHRSALLAADDP